MKILVTETSTSSFILYPFSPVFTANYFFPLTTSAELVVGSLKHTKNIEKFVLGKVAEQILSLYNNEFDVGRIQFLELNGQSPFLRLEKMHRESNVY